VFITTANKIAVMNRRSRRRNGNRSSRQKEEESGFVFSSKLEPSGEDGEKEAVSNEADEETAGIEESPSEDDVLELIEAETDVTPNNEILVASEEVDGNRDQPTETEAIASSRLYMNETGDVIDSRESLSEEMIPRIKTVYSDSTLQEPTREEEPTQEEEEEKTSGDFKSLAELFQNITVEKSDSVMYLDEPEAIEEAEDPAVPEPSVCSKAAEAPPTKALNTLSQEDLANLTMKDQKPFKSGIYDEHDDGVYSTTIIYEDNKREKTGWFRRMAETLGRAFCCYSR
jgi:hypothetical protein